MFAQINNLGKIDFTSSEKVNDNMIEITQEQIEKIQNGFVFQNGELIEGPEVKENEKIKLKNELEKVTNDLVNINGRIKGAEDLKLAGMFDEDDEIELAGYKGSLEELVIERAKIKAKIKELD